ncbi:MAG: pyridoxamine 5'-phosphate oxidase family protein [Bdellovibrionota bacterium]
MSTVLDQDIKKLFELIRESKTCMLTTSDSEGNLRSRPMANQSVYFDNYLYFLTDRLSGKVEEITENASVNLSYEVPAKNHYVSVSGRASLIQDKEMMKKFWSPLHKAWFPEGLDGTRVSLLKVTIEKAEFWDSESKAMQLISQAKAMLKGQRYQPKEDHKKIENVIH